ncbi:unnamed protein product [Pedinophyceae sp. YPF-701]|nr:unnamed protein product [Pedinophyceae sp. YPF-701]
MEKSAQASSAGKRPVRHPLGIRPLPSRGPKVVETGCLAQERRGRAAMRPPSALRGGAGGSGGGDARPQYLYDRKTGLPIVRDNLSYGDLLRDIRTEKVQALHWLSSLEDEPRVQGPCLVEYRDGSIKQAHVPSYDTRTMYAMETHGVRGTRFKARPANITATFEPSQAMMTFFNKGIPAIGLLIIWAAAQYASHLKGDKGDRADVRAYERDERKRSQAKQKEDTRMYEAQFMAERGATKAQIMERLKRNNMQDLFTEEDVDEIIAAAQRKRKAAGEDVGLFGVKTELRVNTREQFKKQQEAAQAAREAAREEEGLSEMESAQRMLQMRTVKRKSPATKNYRAQELKRKLRQRGTKVQDDDSEVFFDDVAGIGEAKAELQEVVDFFVEGDRFKASGAKMPKGVLLCGPPGTGKTLLARAVAGEAGAEFLSVNASEFVEMFVGVGAARVRDLFASARALAPCIIFIDEIDAVGRVRGGAQGNDERDQTLNQMLSCMDGFDSETDVVVIAATNRKDILDPALIRPGRFDRIVYVDVPDFDGRIEVMKVHLRNKVCDIDALDLRSIAFETQRYSGAQLANLINQAAVIAGQRAELDAEGNVVRETATITQDDLRRALEYERLGPRVHVRGADRLRRMAIQEAATCVIATLMPSLEEVSSATIVPREKHPLGHTVLKICEQREATKLFTRRYLEEQLRMELAGRAAEEVLLGVDELSSINQRRLVNARRIVEKLVVSEALIGHNGSNAAPRTIARKLEGVGGAKKTFQVVPDTVSGSTHAGCDEQMTALLSEAYDDARAMLVRNRAALEALVDELLEKESLTGEQVRDLVSRLGDKRDLEVAEKEGREEEVLL